MSPNSIFRKLILAFLFICCAGCDSEDDGNRVQLGVSANLFELDTLQYQEEFAVQVSDANGAPSPSAIVTLKLIPVTYNKGQYVPTDITIPPDGTVDRWGTSITAVCDSEDINANGALDGGEDVNGNGILDPDVPTLTTHPTKTPTVTPGTNLVVTDENGFGYFAITYPKSEGAWSSVRVTADVSDGLPGNTANYVLDLGVLIQDLEDLTIAPPSGGPSPYGTAADCTDPD
mgnify:CR=1 FL=1